MSNPSQMRPLIIQALGAFERQDYGSAEAICWTVLQTLKDEPTSLMVLGLIRNAQGAYEEALQYLSRAQARAPRNATILSNLGIVQANLGDTTDAIASFRAALVADPRHLVAQVNLAKAYDQLGRLVDAEGAYRAALALQAGHPEALAGLAGILEQNNALDEADALAQQALQGPRAPASAAVVAAKIAVRQGRGADARSIIQRFRQSHAVFAIHKAFLDGLEGQALELDERYSEAFAAFGRSNEGFRAFHAPQFEGVRTFVSDDVLDALRVQTFVPSDPGADGQREGHVFLVGFPRSGTTLLETALAAHRDIQSLEETETLQGAFDDLLKAPSIADFQQSLTPHRMAALRRDYWARVGNGLGAEPVAAIFIDKMPIYSGYIGFIAALFPKARFIFALRDPRDAVLSAFQQRFGMNAAMFRLLSLESAAMLYDKIMDCAQVGVEAHRARVHFVRFETLVTQFESEMRSLTDFLKLPWDAGVLNYRATAKAKSIATPSGPQVMEPLSAKPIGKWRHYGQEMALVLPILARWVRHYGYPDR